MTGSLACAHSGIGAGSRSARAAYATTRRSNSASATPSSSAPRPKASRRTCSENFPPRPACGCRCSPATAASTCQTRSPWWFSRPGGRSAFSARSKLWDEMDRIQQLAQIVEVQQMQIEHWKGVTVALSLVVRAVCEKLSAQEVEALIAEIEKAVLQMELTDGEIETVKATLHSLLRMP